VASPPTCFERHANPPSPESSIGWRVYEVATPGSWLRHPTNGLLVNLSSTRCSPATGVTSTGVAGALGEMIMWKGHRNSIAEIAASSATMISAIKRMLIEMGQ